MLLPAVITFSLFILNYIAQIGGLISDAISHEQMLHQEAKYDIEIYNCLKAFGARIQGETGLFVRDFNIDFNWLGTSDEHKASQISETIEQYQIEYPHSSILSVLPKVQAEIPGTYFVFPPSNTHICTFFTDDDAGIESIPRRIKSDENDSRSKYKIEMILLLDHDRGDNLILRDALITYYIENENL